MIDHTFVVPDCIQIRNGRLIILGPFIEVSVIRPSDFKVVKERPDAD